MDTEEIFNKIKEENIKYEKNIANRIMEGNENLKKTLAKIKKEMEKLSIHSNVNYDSLKNDYKKEKIFKIKENNPNIKIINLNQLENKNENMEKETNDIKLENQIQNENDLKFEIEESSITEEFLKNHNNKINNQNIISSIRSSHKRNKESIDSFSRSKNKKTAVTSDSLSKSSANIIEKNNIKKINNKNTKRIKNKSQPPKIKFIQASLNNVKLRIFDNENKIIFSKSPDIENKKKIKKKNLIPKNKSIGNSIIQSSSKKKTDNISKIINKENEIEEQNKKIESLDSNKLYYDVDSENKIISKNNTLRSNKFNTNNSDINLDSNFNTININSNNNNFNNSNNYFYNNNTNNINSNNSIQNNNNYNYNNNNSNNNSSFLRNASRRAVYNSGSGSITRKEFYQNQNSLSNLNPSYSSNFFHISENSNANSKQNSKNSKQNSNTISTKNSKKHKSFSQDNIIIINNKKDLTINEKQSDLDSINSSILKNINYKSINCFKYNNDDIYEKKLFKKKINNAKKEYIKLKNEIVLLKKKKDYLKKTIEEGQKTPFIPKPKTLKKFKTMNVSKVYIKNNSAKNLKIEKDISKDMYLDFKLKEEELLKKLNKIEEIPDIDPNNDVLGKYIDKIIFRSMRKYKNRQCLKCTNFLSKGFSVKNCKKRHHIFREQYSK